ncbi:MAG: T9SS type A sorting domain-containing protein [Bacteroidales bacterium]|nr:T9SS type A sorting domain-containing protein [Bacteroidales bacterium]
MILLECFYLKWENSEWCNDRQLLNVYDNKGFLIQTLHMSFNNYEWEIFGKTEFVNNENGKPVEVTNYSILFPPTGGFELISHVDLTYDDAGFLIEKISKQYWPTGYWCKYIYTYDPDGKLTQTLQMEPKDDDWDTTYRNTYMYEDKLLIEQLDQNWENGIWKDDKIEHSYYDDNEYITEKLMQKWIEYQWINYSHWTFSYFANYEETEEIYEIWGDSAWNNKDKYYKIYDESRNLIKKTWQVWEDTAWLNYEKEILIYGPVGIDENTTFPGIELNFSNAPNPFRNKTTISFYINEKCYVVVKIFDIKGKCVNTIVREELQSDTYQYIWDGTDRNGNKLGTGVYLYSINAGGKTAVNKLAIVKY